LEKHSPEYFQASEYFKFPNFGAEMNFFQPISSARIMVKIAKKTFSGILHSVQIFGQHEKILNFPQAE
jgi:hypothetical protein